MNILLRSWSAYTRATARWPGLAALVPFIPVIALWVAVTESGMFPRAFLPGPVEVVKAFFSLTYRGILPDYLQDSLVRLFTGAALGMLIGIPLGGLIGTSRWAHRVSWPILLFFQAIGDIAWLPILLIWFGFGLTTMTFVIVYTVLFPVVLNTVLGVESVPRDLARAARSPGASPARVLWEVSLPGALPNIITGLILSVGRVSGETAPILFTVAAYFLPQLPGSIFDQCMALPYHLYVISTSGTDVEASRGMAYGTALVLIAIVLIVNLLANALRSYFAKKVKMN